MTKIFASIAVATALFAVAPAFAADLPDTPMAPVVDDSGFNWEGPYIGANVGTYPGSPTISGELGYNFLPSESFLIGINGALTAGQGFAEVMGSGRAGFVAGNFAMYGIGGLGMSLTGGAVFYEVGAGAELALNDNWSLEGEVTGRGLIGNPITVIYPQVGIRYHF